MTETVSTLTADDYSLPSAWTKTTVGDIYRIVGGGTPSTKKPEYWDGHVPWISSADIHGLTDVRPNRTVTQEGVENSATNIVPEGSLIVVTRVGLGKVAISPEALCFSQDSQGLIGTGHVLTDYALYYLSEAVQTLKHQGRGTTISGVTKKQLAELPFHLPPLNEQRRIVEKIEELFTRLDAGVEALKHAQAQLKKYRQSVLNAAVTGELSREWREAHAGELEPASELLERILEERREKWTGKKYKEPEFPGIETESQLPDGWAVASFEQVSWASGYGTSVKCSYDAEGPPVLRIPNISAGKIRLEDIKFASNSDKLKDGAALAPGDLLIIRTNGSKDLIGRAAVVEQHFEQEHFFASYLIRYRLLGGEWLQEWLSSIWHSHKIRRWIETVAATSAGQYNVSVSSLNKLTFPIPPKEEAEYISAEVERRFSVVDRLEATIEDSLKRSESLRQSILKRAFSGRLVAQDPDDEPASALLERIREERLSTDQKGKKRKAKKDNAAGAGEPSLFSETED